MDSTLLQIAAWYVGFPLFVIVIGWTSYYEARLCDAIKRQAPAYYEHIGRPGRFELHIERFVDAGRFRNQAMFGRPDSFPDDPQLEEMLGKHHRNNKLLFGMFAGVFLLAIASSAAA